MSRATFQLPRPTGRPSASLWRWRVESGGVLEVEGEPGPPSCGDPALGNWESLCTHVQRRSRGYLAVRGRLVRIEMEQGSTATWPMRVAVHRSDLLSRFLAVEDGQIALHSAWLCPEVPLTLVTDTGRLRPVGSEVPAPG